MIVCKSDMYIALLLTMYFVGMLLPFHNAWLLLLIFMYLYYLDKWIKLESIAPLKMIIFFLLLQNPFLGVSMHWFGIPGTDIRLFGQIPAIVIILTSLCFMLGGDVRNYRWFILYMVIIAFNCIISPNKDVMPLLYNVRNFIMFYCAYVAGKYVCNNDLKIRDFVNFIIKICIFSGLIGIIGFISDNQLYRMLGASDVANIKTLSSGEYMSGELPGYFLGEFFGTYMYRMGSLFLEPVNFSSFMSLAVVLRATNIERNSHWFELIFLIVCQVMTFGKGGLLISSISIFSLLIYKLLSNKCEEKQIFKTAVVIIVTFIIVAGVAYATFYPDNMHFYSIVITTEALISNPFGFGVGSLGNVNKESMGEESFLGAETGVLNICCQLGIEGLAIFTGLIIKMALDNLEVYKFDKTMLSYIFSLIPIILYMVFIFQENTFTVQVITGYMFVIGAIGGKKIIARGKRIIDN